MPGAQVIYDFILQIPRGSGVIGDNGLVAAVLVDLEHEWHPEIVSAKCQ